MKHNSENQIKDLKEINKKLSEENLKLKIRLEKYKAPESPDNENEKSLSILKQGKLENYFNIFRYLPVNILLFDNRLQIIDMNEQCRISLNIEKKDIENIELETVFDSEVIRQFENTLIGGFGFYEGANKKSSSIYYSSISLNVRPYTFVKDGNEIKGGIAVFEDISEQHLSEIAVNMSLDTMQTVLENIDATIYVVDSENFKVKYMNRIAMDTFGKNPPKDCRDFFSKNQKKPCSKCPVNQPENIKENCIDRCEWQFYDIRKKRWFRYSASPIKWIDSTKVVLIVVFDITIQKKADLKIKEQNKELASQTHELERAILKVMEQNVRINSQADELMQSARTKDKMFSIIGHDLRGPIGNIKNILDILLEDFEHYTIVQIREFLNPVSETAKSAHYLLTNLLYWAKSQSGMMVVSPENFTVNELILENISLLSSDIENKNIRIFFDNTHEFSVFADENMVNTIVRNLISNALKFSFRDGKISISINSVTKNAKQYVEISISDTGKGIEEENMGKLFKNTEHFSTYGTNNEKGSGLGLILCKEFTELMGGEIHAESQIYKGSTFSFTLPASV
jgi:signal transduction histidine kinase